ncbi:hypothetical protein JCGZ_25829 [Jatropha curcas]|uniref:Uncharacterized protein n=1 Tax=Jatropha curcas TaxID=180498 RepID=A0A067JJU5_JATCU|nr:kelch-like protein 4 [Jatropha curcas]KDP24172.1 hypothetical protein JCGZ_25829 [Jatropha curcas]
MGSLSPQSPSQSSQQNPPSNCGIFASFCSRDASPNSKTNISNWIECYNPSINAWHHVTRIPGLIENHALKDFSMVSIGNSIYIIGGRLCNKLPGHVQDEVDLEVRSSVLRYSIRDKEWYKCASLKTPRFDFACTVSDNKIYVAGGKCMLTCPRGISSAEVYDPALDEWKTLPKMSSLRHKCVGVTWQGKIYVMGGFAERGDSNNTEGPWHTLERSSAEVYDSESDKWDLMLGMWQLDVPPNQIVAVNGNLFSSGDCLNAWKGHIEAYDGKLNIWNEVDGSHLETLSSPVSTSDATEANWPPIQRLYLSMAPIGTHLYFLAGYRMPGEKSRSMSVVHVFDTSANKYGWRSFEPMEEEGEKELCSHCCVAIQTL